MSKTVSDATWPGASDGAERVEDRGSLRLVAPSVTSATAQDDHSVAAFVDFVLGDEGQAILADYGFGAP